MSAHRVVEEPVGSGGPPGLSALSLSPPLSSPSLSSPSLSPPLSSPPLSSPPLSSRAERYLECSSDQRSRAIRRLRDLISAAHAELLDVIAAAEASRDWAEDGATSMESWLVAMEGLATPSAREWVRVARELQDLPALRDAYAEGQLSWDQVRPATRFVTPERDQRYAEELPGYSASQIALMARQLRPVEAWEAEEAHGRRQFSWRRDHRRHGFRYSGFLPFDMGESLNVALARSERSMGPDALTGEWAPVATRRADALHDLASRALAADPDPDLACVVIHAEAVVVDGELPGNGFIGDLALSRGGVLRALCDCRVETALHGPDGQTVGIARASRNVPPWLRRHVVNRDGCCRFPGCERSIRQVHHIVHWATEGGTTDADNLTGLCWSHHRILHEGGWRIEGDPEGTVEFVSPTGKRLGSLAQPRDRRQSDLSAGEPAAPRPGSARSRGSPLA